jgi:phosphoribosyl 1,2-cyclic phosphodiesterase
MALEVCVLASGSSGNATYISSGKARLLIDCGLAAREVVNRLAAIGVDPRKLDGILLSHAHTDHFTSAGTMHARFGVPVFALPETEAAARAKPWAGSFHRVKDCRDIPATLGDISIETFPVPHGGPDAGKPVGFMLESGLKRLGHVTDCGEMTALGLKLLHDADALVLEANYHPQVIGRKLKDPKFSRDWHYLKWVDSPRGHLSNAQCAEVLKKVLTERTKAVFPAHVSENHHDPARDNNDFGTLSSVLMMALLEAGFKPRIVRTYRRDRTEGKASELVVL